MKERCFRNFLYVYENKKELREFKKKCCIARWKPQLNTYQQIVKVQLNDHFRHSQKIFLFTFGIY